MGHDTNFWNERTQSRRPQPGEPPPYVNGHDDNWWTALFEQAANEPEPDQILHVIPEKFGASLWVIREAWDATTIPRRPWIARGYLMRGALTVVSGAGGGGKSSLMVSWAAVLTVGCALRQFSAKEPMRVATYNVEDDADEQKRRFSAMLQRLKLDHDAKGDRLAILGPTDVGTLLTVSRDGVVLNTAAMDELDAFCDEFKPDVLMLDPFVELHGAEENDNTAVRAVLARLRALAVKYNMAVVLLHHARKGAGDPGDPDTLRGASSIVGAARIVLTVAVMTKEEAKDFEIQEKDRRNYFRLDGAKSNYAPVEEAEWFERQEITLDNGNDEGPPDRVAVAWPWKPPSTMPKSNPADLNRVLDIIAEPPDGWLYAPTAVGANTTRWAGTVLIRELGYTEKQAKKTIQAWLQSGTLYEAEYRDTVQRKDRKGVKVNDVKRPTNNATKGDTQ